MARLKSIQFTLSVFSVSFFYSSFSALAAEDGGSKLYWCASMDCLDSISDGRTKLQYSAPNQEQLTFGKNQEVTILSKPVDIRNEGHWVAKIRDKIGLIPVSLIKETKMLMKLDQRYKYPFDETHPLKPLIGKKVMKNGASGSKPVELDSSSESIEALNVETSHLTTAQPATPVLTDNPSIVFTSEKTDLPLDEDSSSKSSAVIEATPPVPASKDSTKETETVELNLHPSPAPFAGILDSIQSMFNSTEDEVATPEVEKQTVAIKPASEDKGYDSDELDDLESDEEEDVIDSDLPSAPVPDSESLTAAIIPENVVPLEDLSIINSDEKNERTSKNGTLEQELEPAVGRKDEPKSETLDLDDELEPAVSSKDEPKSETLDLDDELEPAVSIMDALKIDTVPQEIEPEVNNITYEQNSEAMSQEVDPSIAVADVPKSDPVAVAEEVETKTYVGEPLVKDVGDQSLFHIMKAEEGVQDIEQSPGVEKSHVSSESESRLLVQFDSQSASTENTLNIDTPDLARPHTTASMESLYNNSFLSSSVRADVTFEKDSSSVVEPVPISLEAEIPEIITVDENSEAVEVDPNLSYEEPSTGDILSDEVMFQTDIDSKEELPDSDTVHSLPKDVPEIDHIGQHQHPNPLLSPSQSPSEKEHYHEHEHEHEHEYEHAYHEEGHEQEHHDQHEHKFLESDTSGSSFILAIKYLSSTLINFLPEHLQDTILDVNDALVFTGIIALTLVSICVPYFFIETFLSVRPLKKKVTELNKNLWKVSTAYENQQEEYDMFKKKALAYDEDKQRIQQLEVELHLLKKLESKQKDQIRQQQKELKSSAKVASEVESLVVSTMDERNTAADERDKLKAVVVSLQASLKETSEELETAQAEASTTQMDLELISHTKENLELKVKAFEKEMLELKQKVLAEVVMRRSVQSEKDSLAEEKDSIQEQLTDLKDILHKYEETVNDLNQDLSLKENELIALKETLGEDSTLVDIAEMSAKLQVAEGQAKSLQSRVESITLENTSLTRNYEQTKNTLKSLQSEKEQAETRLQVLESYFKEKEEELRTIVEKYEVEKNIRGKDKDDLVLMIEEKNDEVKDLAFRLENLKDEFEQTKLAHRTEIRALEAKGHENFLSLCQSERKAQDARKEAELLRQKLTAIVKGKETEQSDALSSNGDALSPFMFSQLDLEEVPVPLLPDEASLPSYFGLGGDFEPPAPLDEDEEDTLNSLQGRDREPQRPPPLGRLSPTFSDNENEMSPIILSHRGGREDYSDGSSSPLRRPTSRGSWMNGGQNHGTTTRRHGPKTSSPIQHGLNL